LNEGQDVSGQAMNLTLTAIDAAIGMIFVYLLMSSICSVLQEMIANVTSWRGKHLRNSIQSMLSDPTMTGLAKRLYSHPRISTLTFAGKLPSYIPSETFASALVDIIGEDGNLKSIDGPLAPFVKAAGGEVDKLQDELAKWFDDSMDGFGGWYKRNVQLVIFAIGLGAAAVLNVNSLEIARALWTQPVLRDGAAQAAVDFYKNKQKSDAVAADSDQFTPLQDQLDKLSLPIGWNSDALQCLFGGLPKSENDTPQQAGKPDKQVSAGCGSKEARAAATVAKRPNLWREWFALLLGWLVTAFATSLGSQFWFQTLGQALQLRAAGAKPPKASDDN
jgi:hypothetical protein